MTIHAPWYVRITQVEVKIFGFKNYFKKVVVSVEISTQAFDSSKHVKMILKSLLLLEIAK